MCCARGAVRPTSRITNTPIGSCDTDMHTLIRHWPEGDRPREKLLSRGAESLSDTELLAVLINSGSAGRSAVDVARALLHAYGNVRALARRPVSELQRERGIGPARAVTIHAAFELGRRSAMVADASRELIISSPEDVARQYIPRLRDLNTERFLALLLNNAGHVLRECEISRGTVDASVATPREVFHAAVLELASSVILIHNHPSGVRDASPEDHALTRMMIAAGRTMGIPVQDHIIICGNSFVSFVTEGWM